MSRRRNDFRFLGFLGFVISFIFAAIIYILVRMLGPAAFTELSFSGFSLKGAPELVGFAISFIGGLWYLSKIFMIPVSTATSAGISTPETVKSFIKACPEVERAEIGAANLSELLSGSGMVLVKDKGSPYGIVTKAVLLSSKDGKISDDAITLWKDVVKVKIDVPVSEIMRDFSKHSKLIAVDESGLPLGIVNIRHILPRLRF